MKLEGTAVLTRAGVAGMLGLQICTSTSTAGVGRDAQAVEKQQDRASAHFCNPASRRSITLRTRFNELANEWRKATEFTSSLSKIYRHPAYQAIISSGWPMVPLILRELKRAPDQWFAALESITGENPISDLNAGNVDEMRKAWLGWGKARGLI